MVFLNQRIYYEPRESDETVSMKRDSASHTKD